jgi:5-methylcytosine-specific restriction protein A
MPAAPLKPCPERGCPRLVRRGRCRQHDLKRRHDALRPTSTARGYGAAWRKLRGLVLQRDPVCRDASGCNQRSTDVDHIVARKHGGTDDPSNLRGLCHRHHSRKTAREDGRWGRSDFSVNPQAANRLPKHTRALPDWVRGVG